METDWYGLRMDLLEVWKACKRSRGTRAKRLLMENGPLDRALYICSLKNHSKSDKAVVTILLKDIMKNTQFWRRGGYKPVKDRLKRMIATQCEGSVATVACKGGL